MSTAVADKTSTEWAGVISDLSTKQATVREHVQRLHQQKKELALEVALGDDSARKKLDRIHSELDKITSEADDFDSAILQARQAQQQAITLEAAATEQARQSELARLSLEALTSSAEYDAHLEQVVRWGNEVKATIGQMLQISSREEALGLTKLLEKRVFQLAAESAGLRSLIEFEPSRTKQSEITALESTLRSRLSNWLPTKESK